MNPKIPSMTAWDKLVHDAKQYVFPEISTQGKSPIPGTNWNSYFSPVIRLSQGEFGLKGLEFSRISCLPTFDSSSST
jgi:hypothetical protein